MDGSNLELIFALASGPPRNDLQDFVGYSNLIQPEKALWIHGFRAANEKASNTGMGSNCLLGLFEGL